MRKFFTVFWLFSFCVLNATEGHNPCQERALCIYLSSRLTEAAKLWNNEVSKELDAEFHIFRPQDVSLEDIPVSDIDWFAYQADLEGMKQSDLLLVLPPYGRDCAWEIGWFCGKGIPAIAYTEEEGDWLHDAMIKGGLKAIITNNIRLYDLLLKDPATTKKSYLICSKRDLGKVIKQIYEEWKNQKSFH
jgi:nucleoside 2-deoxyribosyltransferase